MELLNGNDPLIKLARKLEGEERPEGFWAKFNYKLEKRLNSISPAIIFGVLVVSWALSFGIAMGSNSTIPINLSFISFLFFGFGIILASIFEKRENGLDDLSEKESLVLESFIFFIPLLSSVGSLIASTGIYGIAVAAILLITTAFLGLYPIKEGEGNNIEKRAQATETISNWLKNKKKEMVEEAFGERKKSIRRLKDKLQEHLNILKAKSRDDFLKNKFGDIINHRQKRIEEKLSSLNEAFFELERKEGVLSQAIEETVQNLLPEFRKQQDFFSELSEIDKTLDMADQEIEETRKFIRESDEGFIRTFTKVNSALEQASVLNQALIEVTGDTIDDVDRIREPIESFEVDELEEVVNSAKLQARA